MEAIASRYQVLLIDPTGNGRSEEAEGALRQRLEELGVSVEEAVVFFRDQEGLKRHQGAPTAGVYFGDNPPAPTWVQHVLDDLVGSGVPILPVVEDIANFSQQIPEILHQFNGCALDHGSGNLEAVTTIVLENLDLLRKQRHVFISYRRKDSRGIAIQLYEALDAAGFVVFLDTHSIRGSEPFQEELWHRLSNADIVVVLDSPAFLDSRWTEQELTETNAKSIGIVQVVWPGVETQSRAALAKFEQLTHTDFQHEVCNCNEFDQLTTPAIQRIVKTTEAYRARSVGARHQRLVGEFCSEVRTAGAQALMHWRRYIVVDGLARGRVVAVPAIGVPDANVYHDAETLLGNFDELAGSEILVLYDHVNIRERHLDHLSWLENSPHIKGLWLNQTKTRLLGPNDGK